MAGDTDLQWKRISGEIPDGRRCDVLRAEIPGGWLVTREVNSDSIAFVAAEDNNWDGGSVDPDDS